MKRKLCSVAGCERTAWALGLCNTHYARARRNGDPLKRQLAERGAPLKWIEAHKGYEGDECLIWPFARKSDGYPSIFVGGKSTGAHRFMCLAAHGEPPAAGVDAAHSCGRGPDGCVNPRHLRWATKSQNAADRTLHGTDNFGERNGRARLTAEQVASMRAMYQSGDYTQQFLAESFGVSRSTVWGIVRGKQWIGIQPETLTRNVGRAA